MAQGASEGEVLVVHQGFLPGEDAEQVRDLVDAEEVFPEGEHFLVTDEVRQGAVIEAAEGGGVAKGEELDPHDGLALTHHPPNSSN